MKAKKIREMSTEKIKQFMGEIKLELMQMKGKVKGGFNVKNPGAVRQLRKTLARCLTILKERETK